MRPQLVEPRQTSARLANDNAFSLGACGGGREKLTPCEDDFAGFGERDPEFAGGRRDALRPVQCFTWNIVEALHDATNGVRAER